MIDFGKAKDGLVPAVAQDADTGAVLMLAWMNREAFEETLRTGRRLTLLKISSATSMTVALFSRIQSYPVRPQSSEPSST